MSYGLFSSYSCKSEMLENGFERFDSEFKFLMRENFYSSHENHIGFGILNSENSDHCLRKTILANAMITVLCW